MEFNNVNISCMQLRPPIYSEVQQWMPIKGNFAHACRLFFSLISKSKLFITPNLAKQFLCARVTEHRV